MIVVRIVWSITNNSAALIWSYKAIVHCLASRTRQHFSVYWLAFCIRLDADRCWQFFNLKSISLLQSWEFAWENLTFLEVRISIFFLTLQSRSVSPVSLHRHLGGQLHVIYWVVYYLCWLQILIVDIHVLLSEALRSVWILVYSSQIWSFSSDSFLHIPLLDSVKRILIILIIWVYFVTTCHDVWITVVNLPVWRCCSCSSFLLTWVVHKVFSRIAFSILKKRLFRLFHIKGRELPCKWRFVFLYEIFISVPIS